VFRQNRRRHPGRVALPAKAEPAFFSVGLQPPQLLARIAALEGKTVDLQNICDARMKVIDEIKKPRMNGYY
jgi:hypothetical protein